MKAIDMFTKILIANRGEIACRIIRSARSMGISCVAVYSDADQNALHVAMADAAVHIGASAPAESYLSGKRIIDAALASGAQAIHPGYGFLSENPDFVDAVTAAGLVFIGPSADAIRAMGLKDAAKALMENSGVPVVPGYHGENQDKDHLSGQAAAIGYPVLIKAVAGGGGKGMRRVDHAGDFQDALSSAQAEALGAFGNGAVLIEKYVEKPRHIEVQIFGDGTNAVHLFERDCSLQRRHQKVIEEAPAPGMTDEMRAAMGAAAVNAAQAIGYKGAGTVEFIVDAADGLRVDRFWFMEMNTRLQVEHPVTEAITGVDLVQWQLRVAAGDALPQTQDQLHISGHAFEARLYAEDVPAGFLPATGTLGHLQFPDEVRADAGVRSGDTISPFYDPMIAKITVHGATRALALSRLQRALAGTQVAGTTTNLTFLGRLAANAEFVSGDVDTDLIGRHMPALIAEIPPPDWAIARAMLAAAGLEAGSNWATGFSLWQPLRYRINLMHRSELLSGDITILSREMVQVSLPDATVEVQKLGTGWHAIGQSGTCEVRNFGQSVSVFGAESWHFDVPDPLHTTDETQTGGNVVLAPMPGTLKSLFALPGQAVVAGEKLAILEAMKMEHTLCAPRQGIIAEVLAAEGAQVSAGAPLIILDEPT